MFEPHEVEEYGWERGDVDAAVLFCDLVDSVALSSAVEMQEYDTRIASLREAARVLIAEYLHPALKQIQDRLGNLFTFANGFQDRGDEVLVVVCSDEEASESLAEATHSLLQLAVLLKFKWFCEEANIARLTSGRPACDLRMGIHIGKVIASLQRRAGDLGAAERLVGFTLNMGKRVESAGKQGIASRIILSSSAITAIRPILQRNPGEFPADFRLTPAFVEIGDDLKGIGSTVLHEVVSIAVDESANYRLATTKLGQLLAGGQGRPKGATDLPVSMVALDRILHHSSNSLLWCKPIAACLKLRPGEDQPESGWDEVARAAESIIIRHERGFRVKWHLARLLSRRSGTRQGLMSSDQRKRVIALLRTIIDGTSNRYLRAHAYFALASVLRQVDKPDRNTLFGTRDCLKAGLKEIRFKPQALSDLAAIHLSLGEFDECEECARTLDMLYPDDLPQLFGKALLGLVACRTHDAPTEEQANLPDTRKLASRVLKSHADKALSNSLLVGLELPMRFLGASWPESKGRQLAIEILKILLRDVTTDDKRAQQLLGGHASRIDEAPPGKA